MVQTSVIRSSGDYKYDLMSAMSFDSKSKTNLVIYLYQLRRDRTRTVLAPVLGSIGRDVPLRWRAVLTILSTKKIFVFDIQHPALTSFWRHNIVDWWSHLRYPHIICDRTSLHRKAMMCFFLKSGRSSLLKISPVRSLDDFNANLLADNIIIKCFSVSCATE